MRITRICANIANGDANKNRNPNYTNVSEFTNNTNENKNSSRPFVKIKVEFIKNKFLCNLKNNLLFNVIINKRAGQKSKVQVKSQK